MSKFVHVVIKDGCVMDAFSDADVELVVYDLDCQDEEMRAEMEATVAALKATAPMHEVEIN